jgi:hypothetical protein
LPLLDAMVPALTAQSRTAAQAPMRFGAVYFPHGVNAPWWIPAAEERDFEFPRVLKSLEPLRRYVTVVSGLDQPNISIHLTASASFLNGAPPKKTESENVGSEITIDQLIADRVAGDTPFRSTSRRGLFRLVPVLVLVAGAGATVGCSVTSTEVATKHATGASNLMRRRRGPKQADADYGRPLQARPPKWSGSLLFSVHTHSRTSSSGVSTASATARNGPVHASGSSATMSTRRRPRSGR